MNYCCLDHNFVSQVLTQKVFPIDYSTNVFEDWDNFNDLKVPVF